MGDAELTNLTLPYFVTGIEDFAFYMCRSLEEMYLPDLTVDIGPHTLYGCKGLKRGHIKGINLTRFGPDECMIFALLYLSTRGKYSYWEMVMYESFIHEYRDRVFCRILDAGSQDALQAIVHMDMVDAVCLEKWSEAARASGNLEFTAKFTTIIQTGIVFRTGRHVGNLMNIREAKEQIKKTMKAYFSKDEKGDYYLSREKQRPVFLMGPPGDR